MQRSPTENCKQLLLLRHVGLRYTQRQPTVVGVQGLIDSNRHHKKEKVMEYYVKIKPSANIELHPGKHDDTQDKSQ